MSSAKAPEPIPPAIAPVRVFLCAGDPSGDVHGAMLVRELRRLVPDAWFYGVCGSAMRDAGVAQFADSSDFSAIGVAHALPKAPRLWSLLQTLKRYLVATPPTLIVLIDFPAFNMRLLRCAVPLGAPVLYYFPPASWKREPSVAAERLAAMATHVATPFEWSARIIEDLGGRATWVGHPVLDRYADRPSEARARGLLRVPLSATPVAVLPGSRSQEIRYVLPLLLRALTLAAKEMPSILPLVSVAPGSDRAAIAAAVEGHFPDAVLVENTPALLSAASAALTKSGTITLEGMACGLPMVVTYAGSVLDALQYHLFLRGRFRFIAAPNILVGREVVPERYAERGTPEELSRELLRLLRDESAREECRRGLEEGRASLGSPGASVRTAELAVRLMRAVQDE